MTIYVKIVTYMFLFIYELREQSVQYKETVYYVKRFIM